MNVEILGSQDEVIEAEVDYCPPTDDVPYLPNGDPGYPGDPEEIRILAVTIDGEEIDPDDLSERETERIHEAARQQWDTEQEDPRF